MTRQIVRGRHVVAGVDRENRAAVIDDGAVVHEDGHLLAVGRAELSADAMLDFDDLIDRTADLLESEGGASWVLYKLDGGIDHVLIDEAQDTNPEQWQVVTALTEEFFSGWGARRWTRTVFAVGDEKQSIFSFQRADPAEFTRMRGHFEARVTSARQDWRRIDLDVSFRSTAAVLDVVDGVFADPAAQDGLAFEVDTVIRHRPFRRGEGGLVEVWPPIGPAEVDDLQPWAPPVTRARRRSPSWRTGSCPAARRPVRCGPSARRTRRPSSVMPGKGSIP